MFHKIGKQIAFSVFSFKFAGDTKDVKEREFNCYFRKAFDLKHSLPAVFIDAYPDPEDETEMKANEQEVRNLIKLTHAMYPYYLHDIEVKIVFLGGRVSTDTSVLSFKAHLRATIATRFQNHGRSIQNQQHGS